MTISSRATSSPGGVIGLMSWSEVVLHRRLFATASNLHINTSGHVDIGVKSRKIALGLKGRFYANLCFRPKGKILRQVWC